MTVGRRREPCVQQTVGGVQRGSFSETGGGAAASDHMHLGVLDRPPLRDREGVVIAIVINDPDVYIREGFACSFNRRADHGAFVSAGDAQMPLEGPGVSRSLPIKPHERERDKDDVGE